MNVEKNIANKVIIFNGIIHPERVDYNLPKWEFFVGSYGETERANCTLSISASRIFVEAKTNNIQINLVTLKNYVQEVVTNFVNFFCFQKVYGYDVEITSAFITGDNRVVIFSVEDPIFEQKKPPPFPETFRCIDNKFLQFSVNDFRLAIKNAPLTPAYCRRSIEAIANAVEKEGNKFKNMQEALNLDGDYIQKYKKEAHDLRHGKQLNESISWEERKEQLLIAWEISRRYMWYIEFGSLEKLPPDDFPLFKDISVIFSKK